MFTPAGMDIYVRLKQGSATVPGPAARTELVQRIAEALKAHEATRSLAQGGFDCPGVVSHSHHRINNHHSADETSCRLAVSTGFD